jgi:uncharacterized protein
LYEYAISKFGSVSTMIERDDNIPPLADLVQELEIARKISQKALACEPISMRPFRHE